MKVIKKIVVITVCIAVLTPLCIQAKPLAIQLMGVDKPFVDLDAIIGKGNDMTLNPADEINISDVEDNSDENVEVIDETETSTENSAPMERLPKTITIEGRTVKVEQIKCENIDQFKNLIDSLGNQPVVLVDNYAEYHTYIEVDEILKEKGLKVTHEER